MFITLTVYCTSRDCTEASANANQRKTTMSTIPVYLNGRSLSCLVCPESRLSCMKQKHPLQRMMTYDELTGRYARKSNRDRHDGIGIYTCPHCGLDRLTIDALYEHLRATHLFPSAGSTDQHTPRVHCPVCVCFRLEDCTTFIQDAGALVDHMLSRHCFSSTHQYSDELKLRNDFCSDDEFELIRFLATFLPPAIITSHTPLGERCNVSHANKNQQLQSLMCPICLEEIEKGECKDLPMCHHQFHGPCIDRWLVERNCCPICRCDCSTTQ